MRVHPRIYTTVAATITLGFILACTHTGLEDLTDTESASASDSEASGGCPDDMLTVDDAELNILGFEVNYLNYNTTFDVDAEYDDVPAACISEDGTKLRLMVALDGEEFAVFVFEATTADEYDPTVDEDEADFRVRVTGLDETYQWVDGGDDISAGSWVVTDLGETFAVELSITAADSLEGTQLSLQLEASADLP